LENTDERLVEFFSKDKPFTDAFKCLFENASDAIYILDKNGNFVTVNRKAEELTGFKREDFVGKSFRKIIPLKSLPKAIRGFLDVVRGKEVKIELELKTATKKTVLAEVTSTPLTIKEKIVGTLGIVRDITERVAMENKLKEANRRLEMLFDTAMEGITVVNAEENLTFVNKAFADMLGYKEDELVGTNLRKFVDGQGFQEIRRHTENRKKGKVSRYELVMFGKDGKPRIFQVSASPLWNEDGSFAGSLAIVVDVTERKQMQQKLEEYSQQLEVLVEKRTRQLKEAQEQLIKSERLAAIGQVAAMVGHDLRNPLTGINGAAYYLKTKLDQKLDIKSKEMFEIIEKDVQHANKIITDLMEYSREIKLELTETTPKSIMNDALSLVEIPKNVYIEDLTQNEPKTKMDIDKMKRVFSNFIKNAVDAMSDGGKLAISSRESDGNVEIMFVDTGMGMAKEVMEKLWSPFFTTKAKGMGLGLAICKRIIEAHGGKISVESIVREGTTFTVTIPIEPKPKEEEGSEKIWVNVPESLLSTTTKA